MAALSLFDLWLFLSVGGPVAGTVVAVWFVCGVSFWKSYYEFAKTFISFFLGN